MPLQFASRNAVNPSLPRRIPAMLAALGASVFFLVPSSSAQTHTNTSSGSGHAAVSAPSPHTTTTTIHSTPTPPPTSRNTNVVHHSRGYWRGGVYYPYVVGGSGAADVGNGSGNAEAECQGGPTIFDRCSSTPGNYIPPTNEGPAHTPQRGFARASSSAGDSANPTTLVFKDGHEVEVDNYAVAGKTLYDLTPGSSQKIALSDLDLTATEKQNHDHGAVFELPPTPHAN